MDLKSRMIVEEYKKEHLAFVKLGDVVHTMLSEMVANNHIDVLGVEHRVKTEASLIGKLERKGDGYTSLKDLTDILGARIICFFNDDIDKIGKFVEENFVIDWENSCDKRALIKADSFGYLSLHYICSLPFDSGYEDEICGKKFEIQIRTTLQHTWSVINHDIGYKNEFGVPRDVSRQFARLAGLLELADDEFVRARDAMSTYTEDIRQKITQNEADDIAINIISINEYVKRNLNMQKLLEQIASLAGAEIKYIDAEGFIAQLKFLNITTLGELGKMLDENRELALKLAQKSLQGAELDILSSSVGLRFLCRAYLINKNYDLDKITEFLQISLGTKEKAERQALHLLRSVEK